MARKFFTRGRLWGLGLIVFSGLGFAIPFAMAVVGALMGWRDLDEDWPRWLVEILGTWFVSGFLLTWIGLVLLIRGKCTPPWTLAALGMAWATAVLFAEVMRYHFHV